MINDELLEIWKSSSQIEKVKFEKSRLMLSVQSSIDSLNNKVKFRDLREIIAAALVIPVFIYYAWIIPHLITKIASQLIVIWAVFVIYKLQVTRKFKPSAYSENYLSYLQKTKAYNLRQKRLLDDILWWYVSPFIICIYLFELGFMIDSGKELWINQTVVISLLLAVVIYVINKRYAKTYFEPKVKQIEELIVTMEEAS